MAEFHEFPHADTNGVHSLPAPAPFGGQTPPAPLFPNAHGSAVVGGERQSGVNSCDPGEGGVPAGSVLGWANQCADLEVARRTVTEWEPSGDLEADLLFLAAVDRLLIACKNAAADHHDTVARHQQDTQKEKHTDLGRARVERVWRGNSWTWDTTTDVAAAVLEEASLTDLLACLPERVQWRVGDPEKGTPGLRAVGLNPDDFRNRPKGGRWELRFTHSEDGGDVA